MRTWGNKRPPSGLIPEQQNELHSKWLVGGHIRSIQIAGVSTVALASPVANATALTPRKQQAKPTTKHQVTSEICTPLN